ncbi:MAG: VgrG-related protein [Chloroflexi bacterium]|nr:VgrG-related protein [Chloroflexota bacterium]
MPEERQNVSPISIKVEGSPISEDMIGDLQEVKVDHSLHLPSMFTLHLGNHDMKWLEDATLREGKKVEISYGENPAKKLLLGKIAALEPDLNEASPTLVVRGYDLSHALYRGRKRRAFTNMKDSDIVKQLAREAALNPSDVDETSEIHPYVYQNNQTNADFLWERAARVGYEMWVDDDKLHFHATRTSGTPVRVEWGSSLRSFRPRLSTSEQVNEVEVRGWNPKTKEQVVGRATRGQGAPQIGISQPGAEVAQQAWGEAKYAVVDEFVRSASEAEKMAQALLDEMAASFVEADGAVDGNADIKAGKQVEVAGVGQRFNGTYYVTQATHHWTKDQGLKTHFAISGKRDRGFASLIQDVVPPASNAAMNLAIGIVTDNKDPEEMGRVRVKLPFLSESDVSAWARVATPMAGDGRGFMYLPEVDDEVLIGFEHGDIHRPFVIGGLWNGKDKLPMNASEAVGGDGKVNKRVLKSRSGHTITLDDTEGSEAISIVDKTGNNKIVMKSSDNSMEIKVDGDLKIESKGKITFKAMQGMDMNSQTDFKIAGTSGVDMSSQAQLKLSGSAGAEISSPAQTKISGSMVDISGSATVQVTGGLIKLN